MKICKFIFSALILTAIFSCKTKIKSHLQFVYSVDKEGVFLRSLADNSTTLLYATTKVFLNDYFRFINDSTLQIAHQSGMTSEKKERKIYSKYFYRSDGDSTFITDNPPYIAYDNYDHLTDSIYHINIRTRVVFLATVKDYEHYEHRTLNINTRNFDRGGNLNSEKDTSFACSGTERSSKGIRYCDVTNYYAESETVCGKTIITDHGNLILKHGNSQTVLLKFYGHFDPKFGSGYYNPTLSNDGKKTCFQYLAGFLKTGSCIYEMDIKTKAKQTIIGDGFYNPSYSPDNKLLLLFANNRKSKGNTWINDIYVLDIVTRTKEKIGQGENYLWIPVGS